MGKKTAVVVIHGIGEQKPFETLDAFVRPLAKSFESIAGIKVRLRHDLIWFVNWGESCISLLGDEKIHPRIDVFEYYWSHLTQRKISSKEVIDWTITVAQGAKRYYRRRKQCGKGISFEQNDRLFSADGEFDHLKYLVMMMSLGGRLKYIFSLLLMIGKVLPFVRVMDKVIKVIFNLFSPLIGKGLINYLGDVTLYSTTDAKSEHYAVRKEILNGAVEKVRLILENDDYDKILLCGHSLGSVIVYDIIDRLNMLIQDNRELRRKAVKLKGMVTFGSPLDKIAFFFDEYINRHKQPVRYAITSYLHGFRRNNIDRSIDSTMQWYLGAIPWLNFWCATDMVSGHLDVYAAVKNIKLDFSPKMEKSKFLSGTKLFIFSHNLYWQADEMYERIVKELMLNE